MNNFFDWPLFALCDDIRSELRRLVDNKQKFAIATLVDAEGSSPRKIGSQMLIADDRRIWGYVSGGCVESNLCEMAIDDIKSNKSEFVTFGYGSPYIDIRLLCGKKIDIAIDIIDPEDEAINNLLEFDKQRKISYWIGDLDNNLHICVDSLESEKIPKEIKEVIKLRPTGFKNKYYWKTFKPRLRLIVNGANPVTMAILLFARKMGWEVIFNRKNGSDLPEVLEVDFYRRLSGEKLFDEFVLDHLTAVLSLTHDIEADHDIIKDALPSSAFYVGVLGSRKHLPKRHSLLKNDNVTEAQIAKLKAPVGLDLGGSTANEIAIEIIGDIIKQYACVKETIN